MAKLVDGAFFRWLGERKRYISLPWNGFFQPPDSLLTIFHSRKFQQYFPSIVVSGLHYNCSYRLAFAA